MAKKPTTITSTAAAEHPIEVADQLILTPEELQAIINARQSKTGEPNVAISDLATALITAINSTKTPEKKTPFNRKRGGPWESKDGKPKPKLRRVMYQHGILMEENNLSSEEIELLNKIKAGSYCGGQVKVIKRRDRSLDVDYAIRTSSQRLKLLSLMGGRGLVGLLERILSEAADPTKFKGPDEDDD